MKKKNKNLTDYESGNGYENGTSNEMKMGGYEKDASNGMKLGGYETNGSPSKDGAGYETNDAPSKDGTGYETSVSPSKAGTGYERSAAPSKAAPSPDDFPTYKNPVHEQAQSQTNVQTSQTAPDSALRIASLYKNFGRKRVVQGIDFTMHVGEVLGLLGPNGSGKTTTFYMIVGFYKPTSGEVFLNNQRITKLPMYKRARLGISYLPQEPSVFRKLTVEENIWSILETRHDLSKAQKKAQLEDLIEEFQIGRIRKQQAYTLSGGERRRTEIARSLAIEPKFLLLDEPFAGIDPIAVADIKEIIRHLSKRGIGVLITDHNVRDTLEITDRAIIISNGQVVVEGQKDDILKSEKAREIYLGKDFDM